MAVKLTNQKFTTIDANGNKIIDVGNGILNTDAINRGQLNDVAADVSTNAGRIVGSNVWNIALRNEYTAGQTVRDTGATIFQGNITSEPYTVFFADTGSTGYILDPAPLSTAVAADVTFAYVDGSTPLTVIAIDHTDNTVDFSGTPDRNFTLTYPPTNFGDPVGATTRLYVRNRVPYVEGGADVERPQTALENNDFNFIEAQGVYQSAHWIALLINGEAWREYQVYLRGDVVDYVDSNSIPRLAYTGIRHLSTNANAPFQSDAIQHETPSTFSIDAPWEPVGSAVDVSMGNAQDAVQLTNAAGDFSILGRGVDSGRWFVALGQGGTTGVPLPAALRPNIGDNIAFGAITDADGNDIPESQNYEIVRVENSPTAVLYFEGDEVPAEIEAIITRTPGTIVNVFVTNLRTDLGQIDRFIFNDDDFAINTDNQNIGHAHISVIGKQDTLPFLGTAHVWTGTGGGNIQAVSVDSAGSRRRADADREFATNALFEANTDYEFDEDSYIYVVDTAILWEVTHGGTGWGTGAITDTTTTARFAQVAIDENITENLILNSQSAGARSANRWVTTESYQRANLLEKVDTLPATTTPSLRLGSSVYLTTGTEPGAYTFNGTAWIHTGSASDVPDGDATGEILVWDNDTSQYRPVRLLIEGVDADGAEEAENFILDGIIDNPATRATTRAWQETFLLQKFATLAEFEDPVAGSSMYLTAQDGDNDPGPYTYVAGTTNAWEATGGSAILVNSNEVEDPNFVTGPGHSATETYYSPDFAVNGSNVSVEIDTDELGVDLGIAAIRSQISAIEDELSEAQEYVYSQDAAYVDVFLTKRSDELGTFTNTIVVFYSNFDPATNIFTTYARLTDAEWNAFTALVADGDTVVGFGPSFNNFIPFQLLSWAPNGHGTVETGSATYQFELKMIETGAAYTGAGAIADATHKTQFESWATSSPGDTGHPGNTLFYYAEQDTNIASIGHAIANHLLNVNTVVGASERVADAAALEAITIGGTPWNILNDDKNTILNNLEGDDTRVSYPIPEGVTDTGEDVYVVNFEDYDTGGGGANGNAWYYRPNTDSGNALQASPEAWTDLVVEGSTDTNDLVSLIVDADGATVGSADADLIALVTDLDSGITLASAQGPITTDLGTVDAALLYVSDGGTENAAVLRVYTSGTGGFDTRFIIESIVSSVGVPPPITGSLRVSNAMQTQMAGSIIDPSFAGNLDITGNVEITGGTTIGGDLTVTGSTTFSDGSLIQVWPDTYTENVVVNVGEYWERNNRVYRALVASTSTDATTLNTNAPTIGTNWTLVTEQSSVMAGTGITVGEQVVGDVNVFTVATDLVLNRAEVTIPRNENEIVRTGRLEDIESFVMDAITHGNTVNADHSSDTSPGLNEISFIRFSSGTFSVTNDFSLLTHLRVNLNNAAASGFLAAIRDPFMVTWGATTDPDQINWAVIRVNTTVPFNPTNGFTTIDGALNVRQLGVEVLEGEFGGSVQTTSARLSRDGTNNNGVFNAVNLLRFSEPVFDTGTGTTTNQLVGEGIFNLEQTGIETEITGGNINTQFGSLPGAPTSTIHHQPVQSMSYLALQFNSVFQGVRGVVTDPPTAQNAAINDTFLPAGTTIADFTYIEYLSTYDGNTQNVTFVDRVRLSNGDTVTRKFDNAAPALFNVADDSEVIFPR